MINPINDKKIERISVIVMFFFRKQITKTENEIIKLIVANMRKTELSLGKLSIYDIKKIPWHYCQGIDCDLDYCDSIRIRN